MTHDERCEAFRLRSLGLEWYEISALLNVPKIDIYHELYAVIYAKPKRREYPVLDAWMKNHKCSGLRLARMIGSDQYVNAILRGEVKMTDNMAARIAAVTGLTVDEVKRKWEDEGTK